MPVNRSRKLSKRRNNRRKMNTKKRVNAKKRMNTKKRVNTKKRINRGGSESSALAQLSQDRRRNANTGDNRCHRLGEMYGDYGKGACEKDDECSWCVTGKGGIPAVSSFLNSNRCMKSSSTNSKCALELGDQERKAEIRNYIEEYPWHDV